MRRNPESLDILAAPVISGSRYGGRPIYFSDVIVAADSPFNSFADLRGASWAYNDRRSQSGYGVTLNHLVHLGETNGFFGSVVRTGSHANSMRMVAAGDVEASAIDSHLFAVAMRDDPALASRLRVIDELGPSSIQPVVASTRLPADLRADIRRILLAMADDPRARAVLDFAFVERFVPARDADYDDIRGMLRGFEAAGFTTLR